MNDYIDRQEVLNTLCENCDTVQSVCPHYPCQQYTSIEQLTYRDEMEIITEYCRRKNLVIITNEFFRVLIGCYNDEIERRRNEKQ